jgi:hypothetical protein
MKHSGRKGCRRAGGRRTFNDSLERFDKMNGASKPAVRFCFDVHIDGAYLYA